MSKPTGYWVDMANDEGDAWWCGKCARKQDVSLERPMNREDLFMEMPCAWHNFNEQQDRSLWV